MVTLQQTEKRPTGYRITADTPKKITTLTLGEIFDRIAMNPLVMGGKPCIRGTRVTVGRIASQIGVGESIEELLADYPFLERADILQAIQYAEWLAEGRDEHKTRIHILPFAGH